MAEVSHTEPGPCGTRAGASTSSHRPGGFPHMGGQSQLIWKFC